MLDKKNTTCTGLQAEQIYTFSILGVTSGIFETHSKSESKINKLLFQTWNINLLSFIVSF